ncbi:FAD-binding protein [Actinomadura rifamycini]|uniref:FAD-binding protein n=1 Tax=Actinomadura rifamycini TaxID=31962 RepID=UPI003CC5BC5C
MTGAVAERGGRTLRVRARRGVVIATGGFDHDADSRSPGTGTPPAWSPRPAPSTSSPGASACPRMPSRPP